MIVSHIIGGLGNQMFQFAAGRALSLVRGVPLYLDVTGFANYGVHQGFELQRAFDCPAELATGAMVRDILGWQRTPVVRRLVSRALFAAFRRQQYVVEPHFHYWPEISNIPRDSYLTGYWQSEKYFQAVTATIRADFTFKPVLASRNIELAEQISQGNAVSLHVRRGDYVRNSRTLALHGLCSLDYYRSAIQYVAERIARPDFFVFSDDIVWARDNLMMDWPCHYVGHNQGVESYNDMRLMSQCQHHIIANSSFSWWGAWLNPKPEKIVIAPQKWFVKNYKVEDLFPQGWIRL